VNGEYERIILSLEPWLRGVLRQTWEKVPGAYYLKPLGNEAEADGEAEGVAADVRVSLLEKALGVARDIESGRLRPPAKPEQYFKQVMRHAVRDWLDTQPEAANLSSDERAWIDNELFSIGKDEGDEGFSGLETIHAPTGPRAPARPPRPALLTLVRQRFWWKPAVGAEYKRAQQLLDDIPNEHRRQVVLLHLQGHRQEQIAAKVFRTQQAVSKALREQYAAWGWDVDVDVSKVKRIQYVMAFANLVRLFGRVFPDGGFVFPLARPLYFWEDNKPSFDLPGQEFEDELKEEEIKQWWKPGPQQGSKERRQGQRGISHSKAHDSVLYQAIMSDPALAPWTDGLELRHMPQLIAQMIDY